MPIGLVGLIIAAIFAAAMSSIAAELNSLSTATVIDFYRRLWRTSESDAHYLRVSKVVTLFWGLVACTVAVFAANLGPLIDVVNRFGSFFYGSLLGVFVLAIGVKRATSRGAFWGLLAGMAAVSLFAFGINLSDFLNHRAEWPKLAFALQVIPADALDSISGYARAAGTISFLWHNVLGTVTVVVVGVLVSLTQRPRS